MGPIVNMPKTDAQKATLSELFDKSFILFNSFNEVCLYMNEIYHRFTGHNRF
jgi:hypothetical protein